MKRYFLILSLLFVSVLSPAQKIIIYFDAGMTLYVMSPPTYEFQRNARSIDKIESTDPVFIAYVDSIVDVITAIDENSRQSRPSYVWSGMIQMIYVKNEYQYITINMDRSYTGVQITDGFLEINGKVSPFCFNFQIIVDQIISYYLRYKKQPSDEVIENIIHGYREPLYNQLMGCGSEVMDDIQRKLLIK